MVYDTVIDLAGCSADRMCGLLGSSLQRYSEYEHYLGKKEYYDSKDTDYIARYFEQSNSDGASDDTAGEHDRICGRVLDEASVNTGFPQEREGLKRRCLPFLILAQALEMGHVHCNKCKESGNGYQKQDYTSDSYSGYALSLLEKDIQSDIKDINRNSICSYTDEA